MYWKVSVGEDVRPVTSALASFYHLFQVYYKVRQVELQSATDFCITKCDRYYKVRRLLQSATVQTQPVIHLNAKTAFLRYNCCVAGRGYRELVIVVTKSAPDQLTPCDRPCICHEPLKCSLLIRDSESNSFLNYYTLFPGLMKILIHVMLRMDNCFF